MNLHNAKIAVSAVKKEQYPIIPKLSVGTYTITEENYAVYNTQTPKSVYIEAKMKIRTTRQR